MGFFDLCFLAALWLKFSVLADGIPFEIFKSPLEKAKTVLEENILREVGKSIDAYQAKYVSILFSNEFNMNVCYATIEDNLAHAFLKNDWDRYETILSIDKCGDANIKLLDSDKVTLPNFIFGDLVNAKPLPCEMGYLRNPIGFAVSQPIKYFYRGQHFLVHTSIYQTNKSLDFTAQTRLNISYEKVIEIAKSLEFEDIYKQYTDIYWDKNYRNYSKYLRLSFLQSIIFQFKEKSLSEKAAYLALNAVTGAKDVSVYFIGFRKFLVPSNYNFFFFIPLKFTEVFIYTPTIICIMNNTDGHTLLYISGNSSPIHEFANITEVAAWIITQTKNETKRRVLQSHFMLSDAEATLLSYGLEYTLNLISTSKSPEEVLGHMIKLADLNLSKSNIFDIMTPLIGLKSRKDIPLLIASNKEVSKRKYFEWKDIICAIILPLALVSPQVVLFDAFFLEEGLTEVGLAIDDLKDGKNIGQKRLIFGLLNAIPAIPEAFRTPKELKTFYANVRKRLPKKDIALLNLETEEAHKLQLNTDTQKKLEANKDISKMYYTSKATEETEFNQEVTKNLATEGSKRSSATENELQHEIDAQFGKYSLEKAYPSLDIDIQASSIGKKLITIKGQHYLVDNVDKQLNSLYTFEIENGKINNVINTGKTVYYNEKTKLWEILGLKGGAPPPKKIRLLERENPWVALEDANKVEPLSLTEITEPSDFPKDGSLFRNKMNVVVFDKELNGYIYADSRFSNKFLGVTTENKLVELSTERPVMVPEETYINDLTRPLESTYSLRDIEGPESSSFITGIFFREKQYKVFYKNEVRTVLYDNVGKHWHLEKSTAPLEYSSNGEWVELYEKNSFPIKNNFLTPTNLNWDLQLLKVSHSTEKVPVTLNFLLREGVDESADDILKKIRKAFLYSDASASEKRAAIFVYGRKSFYDAIKSETTNFIKESREPYEDAYSYVDVTHFNSYDYLNEFYDRELVHYSNEQRHDLVSFIARLKLSQHYSGIFLTNEMHVPASIYDRKLFTDETKVLYQTPVFDGYSHEYVVPTDVIASHMDTDAQGLVLSSFLDNLKLSRRNGESIDNYEIIFTQSLKECLPKYKEYLKYYSSIEGKGMEITGESYKKINNYFKQLSSTGIQKFDNYKRLLEQDKIVAPFLSKDPAEVNLMTKYNVQIVTVENKRYIVFPTECNIRELYSFEKNEESISNVRSTGKKVYFDDKVGVQILAREVVPREPLLKFFPPTEVSVPMTGITSSSKSNLFKKIYFVKVDGKNNQVLYDYQFHTWKMCSVRRSKVTVTSSVIKENGNWRVRDKNDVILPVTQGTVTNFYIPEVPKIPGSALKIRKTVHYFIMDTKDLVKLSESIQKLPKAVQEMAVIHYDIVKDMTENLQEARKALGLETEVKWSNVRNDSQMTNFFDFHNLGPYYEAARENGYYMAAREIMKYQIMYRYQGFFLDFERVTKSSTFQHKFFIGDDDVLLRYPDKISNLDGSIEYKASNDIFATKLHNPFFIKINDNILEKLEENNGYFGSILQGKQPDGALFPLKEVVGADIFHKTVIQHLPKTSAFLEYMNQESFSIIYNKDFEEVKNYLFPIEI